MIGDYILTIGVATMNRAGQLKEALESCLACELPKETQFVIVDNASTDNTEEVVRELLENSGYDYVYYKSPINLGAGGGRALYYEKSLGDYIYGMDDDAVIDVKKNPDFFLRAIELMDKYQKIATLGTQVDDIFFGKRQEKTGKEIAPDLYKCQMFCGGSHFLRRSVYEMSPYLPNEYGYEELPPSLIASDHGLLNVFCPSLVTIHKPAFNKWLVDGKMNPKYTMINCAMPYAIKRKMYPAIFAPALWACYKLRCFLQLPRTKEVRKALAVMVKDTKKIDINYKMKFSTIVSLWKDFKISIF